MKPADPSDNPAGLPASLTPKQRLEASRAHLQAALMASRGQSRAPDESTPRTAASTSSSSSTWDGLKRSGRRVWARHPLRGAFGVVRHVVGPGVTMGLRPVARQHPWRMLAIAAVVGAGVAWLRPWRLLPHAALGSALFAVLLPRRMLLQELMSSGLFERLTNGELMSRWFGSADQDAEPRAHAQNAAHGAPHAEPLSSRGVASPEVHQGPGPTVLHRSTLPAADGGLAR